jgi:hypothetical protein
MIFNFCVCLSLTNEQAEQHILMTIRAQILASVDQYPSKKNTLQATPLRTKKKGQNLWHKAQLQII